MRDIEKDFVGLKFNYLSVIKQDGYRLGKKGYKTKLFKCICDCGNIVYLPKSAIISGNTKSCGCYKKQFLSINKSTHGHSNSRLYRIHQSMKFRCFSPNCKAYKNYGGRGIVMCDEWKNDYVNFEKWALENGYSDGLTIDRIDNDKNYCPENCCWIPKSEQSKNRRNVTLIEYNGETKTAHQWAKELKIDRHLLLNKIKSGFSGVEAIEYYLNIHARKDELKQERDLKSLIVKPNQEIRNILKDKKITLIDLGKAYNRDSTTISHWLSNELTEEKKSEMLFVIDKVLKVEV